MDDWRDYALCRKNKVHTSVFFPKIRGENRPYLYVVPRLICSQCSVRMECLLDNLEERQGYVGGTTPSERKDLRTLPLKSRAAICAYAERHFYQKENSRRSS